MTNEQIKKSTPFCGYRLARESSHVFSRIVFPSTFNWFSFAHHQTWPKIVHIHHLLQFPFQLNGERTHNTSIVVHLCHNHSIISVRKICLTFFKRVNCLSLDLLVTLEEEKDSRLCACGENNRERGGGIWQFRHSCLFFFLLVCEQFACRSASERGWW